VHIHPFENGNGRWARFIANLWLHRHGKGPIAWPEETYSLGESTIRSEYLDAIKLADAGDLSSLLSLHRRYGPF
jgi:Fic family protein